MSFALMQSEKNVKQKLDQGTEIHKKKQKNKRKSNKFSIVVGSYGV